MGLPDAAAEFARQVVIALAGDAGRASAEDEAKRWRSRAREAEERAKVYADYWGRIEKLVGREFTSPESVIDRVAFLAEQAGQVDSLRAELGRARGAAGEARRQRDEARRQRDELLNAVRQAIGRGFSLSAEDRLREVVESIQRENVGL